MSNLRRLQVTDDPLTLAVWIVHDDLDRIYTLDHATGGRATPPHKLSQLGAQVLVDGLVKAHSHQSALVRSQAEPTVTEDGDMHASADEPSRAICATQAGMLLGSLRVRRERFGQVANGEVGTS